MLKRPLFYSLLLLVSFSMQHQAHAKEEWVKFTKFECDPEKDLFTINWIDNTQSIEKTIKNPFESKKNYFNDNMYKGYLERPIGEDTASYLCNLKDKILKAEIVFSKEYKYSTFNSKTFSVNGDVFRIDPTFRVRIWQKNLYPSNKASLETSRNYYTQFFLLLDILRNEEPISSFPDAEIMQRNLLSSNWTILSIFLEPYQLMYKNNAITICGERYFNGREDFGIKKCKYINTQSDFLITKKDL